MIHSGRHQPYLQITDEAGKACHGQTLQLITKFNELETKKFYNFGQYYKPFFIRNLRMFVISWSVFSGKSLQHSLMIDDKVEFTRVKHLSGATL